MEGFVRLARMVAPALTALLLSGAARAEDAVLPVPVHTPAPVYPPEAREAGREGRVVLALDVDVDGTVLRAEVVTSAGPAFDAAALDAVRSYRFEPGRDGLGRPTAARIQYAVVFELARAAVPSAEGRVLRAGTRAPLAGAVLRAVHDDGQGAWVTTDEAGTFRFTELDEGRWTVDMVEPRLDVEAATFEVVEGTVPEVTLWAFQPRPWEDDDADEVIEVITRRAPEVTERTLRADEIDTLPGSFGDVVRAVQNLPGIARAPFGLGTLVIRGMAPEESRFTLDSAELPLVFHFGGLTTVVNGALLDEVSFLPGSFGVRFGRNLGGRVDLRTTRDIPERTHGYVSVDLFQATAFTEIRAGDNTAFALSLRRSYVDSVLNPILSSAGESFRAPRYFDAQMRMVHRFPDHGTLDAMIALSDDRFVSTDESLGASQVGLITTFQKGRLQYRSTLQGDWRQELTVMIGPDTQSLDLPDDEEALERRVAIDVREEIREVRDDGSGWRMGIDLRAGPERFRYKLEGFGPDEEAGEGFVAAPAMYVEPTFVWGPVRLTPGLRMDLVHYAGTRTLWSVDPRAALQVDVTDTTTIAAAVGKFTSFPTLRQLLPSSDGNPELDPSWALQSSVGVRQRLPFGMSLEATAFLHELHGLVVGREDRFRFFTVPPSVGEVDAGPYDNAGSGRTFGLELLFRMQTRRMAIWVSATLSRSEREGRISEGPYLFDYDQPVVLNGIWTYALPKRWQLGARARYASGNPYQPVANRVYDLTARQWLPLFGEKGEARLPSFWSLDVRVDKEWVFRRWALTLYLDILNVTNNRNLEVVTWSEDFGSVNGIRGLPILPVFGLKGAW